MIFSKAPRQESTTEPEAQTNEIIEEASPFTPSDTATISPEEASAGTENLQAKYDLLQDQYARLAADFDNYRKRIREEQESLVKYGAQKTVLELLPVLDNLERAASTLNENSDPQVLFKSFGIVQKQLLDKLDTLGVKKISAIGQEFDPQFHEAVNRMESAEFPENTIMYEAQGGYTLHDRVIRPAMVVVSTGSSGQVQPSAASTAEPTPPTEEVSHSNPFIQ